MIFAERAPRREEMTNPFDASLIDGGPVSAEVLADQDRKIADLMQRPNALANARLHAEQHMARLIRHCNRTAWGTVTSESRGPTPEEAAALLDRLDAENRDKLLGEARAAAEQRILLAKMEEAQQHTLSQLEAEQVEAARHDAAAQERAEFEAYDAASKEERFQAWRMTRRNAS
jgi:hypothetical protein